MKDKYKKTCRYLILLAFVLLFSCFLNAKEGIDINIKYHHRPKNGDICIQTHRGYLFIRDTDRGSLDSCLLSNAIGVVYHVKGKKAKIIGGNFSKPIRWSNAILFSVNKYNVPSYSDQLPVYLLKEKNLRGYFNYHRSNGSVREYVEQLNSWFLSNDIKGWSAYMQGENGFVKYTGLVDDNTGYDLRIGQQTHNRVTASFANVNIEESYCRNQIKQKIWVCGMNRKRMEEHCKERDGQDSNPLNVDLIDGKIILYDIIPVSECFYNKSISLRKRYKSYSNYLDACMVRYKEKRYGIMKYKSGKEITQKLANVRVLFNDKKLRLFPAAYYSYNYKANSNDNNEWWLPSMYELALIMKDPDMINKGLSLIPQWDKLKTDMYYWSCCPCNTYYVWFYHCDGMSDANNMCGADKNGNLFIRALPVTEISF